MVERRLFRGGRFELEDTTEADGEGGGIIEFSRPTRGAMDFREVRGFGIFDGGVFMVTGPNVVRRALGFGGCILKMCQSN
mmetsp:Transcript_13047/g.19198  ORF Transcript_13047/g.19198 Transcript_13047/m.19198 type:complete len:80 (-) Transcript_13047:177-416(-)